MSDVPRPYLPRREMYQGAGRARWYPAYLALDVIWLANASYLIFADLVLHDTSLYWIMMSIAIAAAILHSLEMTIDHPRLVLRSSRVGIIVFALAWLIQYFIEEPISPAALAIVAATAHYLWIGETWTHEIYRRQALVAAVERRQQQKEN